jgi:arsenate reductase
VPHEDLAVEKVAIMIRQTALSLGALLLFAASTLPQTNTAPASPRNAFVTTLAFAQQYATPKALAPANDRRLKATLLSALSEKPPVLSFEEVSEAFDKKTFDSLANGNTLSMSRLEKLLADSTPPAREQLFTKVREHAELLTTQFDQIDEKHQQAASELAAWIAKNYDADKPLGVSVICTGNSRRSMLGSTMGNIAAAYYGLPNLRFHSGGTAPSAFNARTITALKALGVEVEASGDEAPRGKAGEPNLIYKVRWGERLTMQEFSKLYNHEDNPQHGYAAILVCHEADAACPIVDGAAVRIPAPYFDPKAFDGAPFEAAKYAERRDDIGRMMLCALMQASNQIRLNTKAK